MKHLISLLVCSSIILVPVRARQDPLSVSVDKNYGQVEVGGHYVGLEFHRSFPLPSRISFYYPVANSIDVSKDYWRREESMPMAAGVRIGEGARTWIGKEAWRYRVSPHRVSFMLEEGGMEQRIDYDFCKNQPAFVFRYSLKNTSARPAKAEVYTHLLMALRTCQTYALRDLGWTEFDSSRGAVTAHFDSADTDSACVVVLNAMERPAQWTTDALGLGVADSGTSRWLASGNALSRSLIPPSRKSPAVAAFLYRKEMQPGDSISIVQVIGSFRNGDLPSKIGYLRKSWRSEADDNNVYVQRAATDGRFDTGDMELDRSAIWARGILAANAHYLNGSIVPMPCPAEYNFFFTHDVLLTDLGAVYFDPARVRKDLLYIRSLAKDDIIPHAYYWRDDGYKTEYCTPENWNHLWFVLTTSAYVRHSMDDSTANLLYPLVTKSIEEVLTQKGADDLMHGFRPDWWDIGHIEGSRAYLTILAIQALREYVFISAVLRKESERLIRFEQIADRMQQALSEKLWDPQAQYLMSYVGEKRDPHYYMGSLLGTVYGLLDKRMQEQLVETAGKRLVDPGLGVRIVTPADFHLDSIRTLYKIVDNEAGDPYVYANGGIWPHANAWYAMALQAVGRENDALKFVKATMTINGVINSPMGQPAMYEYRYSDPDAKDRGRIDKPSFMWAAGMYMNVLYKLSGVTENSWNISFAARLPSLFDSVSYPLAFGSRKRVTIRGRGAGLERFSADGVDVPSLVIPLELRDARNFKIRFGQPVQPYLESVNALVHSARYDHKARSMSLNVSSFDGNDVTTTVVGLTPPMKITIDGVELKNAAVISRENGIPRAVIHFVGTSRIQALRIIF